jgi:hypothetical protein
MIWTSVRLKTTGGPDAFFMTSRLANPNTLQAYIGRLYENLSGFTPAYSKSKRRYGQEKYECPDKFFHLTASHLFQADSNWL